LQALVLLSQGHFGGIYNLGTGYGLSVREILEAIAIETGRAVPSVLKGRRAGDPPVLVADPGAAKDVLEFSPRHSDISTIIRSAWAWHQRVHPLRGDV
jgi:UDP-glucose 4-epimerase